MIHRFADGNGYIDTNPEYRHIGRYIWTDDYPYPQWLEKPIYQWTVTELYGISDDDYNVVFEHVRPFPSMRTLEERIADELKWKKLTPLAWYQARKLQEELPKVVAHLQSSTDN